MKLNLVTHLFLVFFAALAATRAGEQVRGWYEAGGTLLSSAKLESFLTEFTSGNKVEFDPGFRFGIGLGTDITRYLALEVESGFHYNGIRSISGAYTVDAQVYQVPALGNVVLQFPN